MSRRPHPSPLFPYTTLFRSRVRVRLAHEGVAEHADADRAHLAARPARCLHADAGSERDERRGAPDRRSEEHTSELQSTVHPVCRRLIEKKKRLENITMLTHL